ncbi:MAG: PD-(D/E)XK nuclease family protein [Candidatus Gastranaerophilales bacterium]|nr:PD-(D/E)XK nuclease family protein [Candidatus Gastranaerophilales bacterium]
MAIASVEEIKKCNFNFFNELAKIDKKGKGINERCHSMILAWLLNAKGKNSNTLQYCFLKNFIKALGVNDNSLDFFVDSLTKDIVVETEFHDIDIFLYSKNADFVCVIENKIDGELGKNQLKKYADFINTNYDCKYKHFVYLRRYLNTKKADDDKQILSNNYQEIEYSDIAEMIDKTALENAENEKMYFNVLQYKEYLDLYWYDTINDTYTEGIK